MFKRIVKISHLAQESSGAGNLWFKRSENWGLPLVMLYAYAVLLTFLCTFRSVALNWKQRNELQPPVCVQCGRPQCDKPWCSLSSVWPGFELLLGPHFVLDVRKLCWSLLKLHLNYQDNYCTLPRTALRYQWDDAWNTPTPAASHSRHFIKIRVIPFLHFVLCLLAPW